MMKKFYTAPILECWAFCSATAFANGDNTAQDDPDPNNSNPWNDGELDWT